MAEARALGVEQVLLDAGAHVAPLWRQHVEGVEEPVDLPVSMMVPGVPGTLNLRPPDACQALLDAAASAGTTVQRGVRDVTLAAGRPVRVSYRRGGTEQEVAAPLVVGADGRASTVRKQVGISLQRQEPMNYIAGLLLDGLNAIPSEFDVMVGEGELFFILFHQGPRRARAYLAMGESRRHAFSGRDGVQPFLAATRFSSYPWSEEIASAIPAGPCATYAGDDSWADTPYAPGVVLGDAAGYTIPSSERASRSPYAMRGRCET